MAMVGQYHGPEGSAALAVVAPVWNIIYSLGLLMGIGGSVLFSTIRGKADADIKKSNEYFTASVIGSVILAAVVWLIIILFDRQLLIVFGAQDNTLTLAREYVLPIKFAIPFFLFNQMLAAYLRNDKNPALATGAVLAFLYGFFSYPLYSYAMIAEILLAVILLVVIMILGMRKPVRYIGRLKAECEILGSGDLDYQVTVQGKDELSLLARGLDNMRIALRESNEKEAELTAANRRMITEMSHDLRTPLTSLLIYTEILGKEAVKDPQQLMEYVRKIEKKARQIKRLSDNIFEYALITEETEAKLGEPQTLWSLFYDPLSEMTAYLEERGYTVELQTNWGPASSSDSGGDSRPDDDSDSDGRQIRVNEEYINRIMDNIVSNIEKYADKSMPVRTEVVYTEEYGGLAFQNGTACDARDRRKTEGSTNIGLHNVEKMMKNMNGYCGVEQTERTFEISLMFPWMK
mgnify:FL=1